MYKIVFKKKGLFSGVNYLGKVGVQTPRKSYRPKRSFKVQENISSSAVKLKLHTDKHRVTFNTSTQFLRHLKRCLVVMVH